MKVSSLRKQLIRILGKSAVLWPDEIYLRLMFFLRMGYKLNLQKPVTFSEKLQWLKIHNRQDFLTNLVDKVCVKEYVNKRIGNKYIIPTIGVYDSVEKIPWNELPKQFILKCSHDSGGIVICKDKDSFDINNAKKKLKKGINQSYYKYNREWPYKNVPKKILAEELISSPDGDLRDYKFFCFNGEPKFLKVDFGRFTDHHANYYDLNWNLLPFGEAALPPIPDHIEKCPENFDEMIEIARNLSKGHKFIRVDLYNVEGKIYFGELTFYPASGMGQFTSKEWDYKLGSWLELN